MICIVNCNVLIYTTYFFYVEAQRIKSKLEKIFNGTKIENFHANPYFDFDKNVLL